MFTKSIRWRLQLWLAFLLACVLSGFGVAVFQLHRLDQFNQIDDELSRRVAGLGAALHGRPPFGPGGPGRPPRERGPEHFDRENRSDDRPPDGPRPFGPRGVPPEPRDFKLPPILANAFDQEQTNSFYFIVWSRSGTILKAPANAPPGVVLPERRRGDPQTYTRTRDIFREAFHFTEMGDCILVGHSVAADLEELNRFTFWLCAAGLAVLGFGCGGGWLVASAAIRPLEQISAAASRISAGNLSERIQGADSANELGKLASVLNSTFGRLETAFAQQKQFTADAAHELRTPLAVLISETQTTLARERSAAEYREAISVCLDTAQQMKRLTESLLTLARVDAGEEKVAREPFDLADLAASRVHRIQPLADQEGLQVICHLESAMMIAHRERIGQVITNLLSNAIFYNKSAGKIEITTQTTDGKSLLSVADSGRGIGPDDLPHIFERFYRADKARSGAPDHAGLGLAICKSILDAEHAEVAVTSELGKGTVVTVSFLAASRKGELLKS